ncbi:MAG: hypothetical protein ACE144_20940 [Thermodesulfobacteriota bacterium]
MTLEFLLLLLESGLLIATVVMLIYSIHEGKRRDHLLREVGRVTKVLTRQEYFFSIMEAMADAKREIIGCITGTPPSSDDIRMTRHIADAIERLTKKGVIVRYLLPKFPDRLQIGLRYTKAGAEISFSSCLMVHNLRYIVVDEETVVFGMPERTGDKEATKKGYTIPSEGLAALLKNDFSDCKDKTSLKDYLQEVLKQTGATLEHLAREFHLDPGDLNAVV